MALIEMTVCDRGDCLPIAAQPYQFYAQIGIATPIVVKIVMPLGGTYSGLFRYPKTGEKVLVSVEGDSHYLLGYLPGESQPFSPNGILSTRQAVINKQGQVFRYKKTGENNTNKPETDPKFSEIGFYNEETAWSPDGPDGVKPKIDRINIQSTGDIHIKAQNYEGFKAKRMEIAIDQEGDLSPKAKAGDLAINAKHDIIISSESSITLKVGRSSITINDTGIVIKSAKINSPIATTWDSSLLISPIDGIVAGGSHVKITGNNDVSISDKWGGGFTSNLGVSRVNGFDIRLETMAPGAYSLSGKMQGAELAFNGVAMAAGIGTEVVGNNKEGKPKAAYQKAVKNWGSGLSGMAPSVLEVVKGIVTGYMPAGKNMEPTDNGCSDLASALVGAVAIASQIAGATASVLTLTIPTWPIATSSRYGAFYIRDTINAALAMTESGLALGACYAMVTNCTIPRGVGVTYITKSIFHLQGGGQIYEEAYKIKMISADDGVYQSPIAGTDFSLLLNIAGKYPWQQGLLKMAKAVTTLGMKFYEDPELDKL